MPKGTLDREFPVAIATIPATRGQRRTALGVIIALIVVAALVAPFANVQLGRVDAFVPVLQTVLAVADLITAVLLFAQYLVVPQGSLLAVASAYLCSASFAFLQTLAFPGAYGSRGLIGDGFNSPAWFFVLWHVTFPLGILTYAVTKEEHEQSGRSPAAAIALTFSVVAVVVAALAWLATARVESLPAFYTADIVRQTRLGNQVNVGLLLWYSIALVALLRRRRTILDIWLAVILVAWMPNFLVAALASSVRFSLGWYAARGFALVASFLLLSVLLTEMTLLYSRLANAFSLLRRERTNRLMTVDAATAAIAHEVRSPLGAISINASTALCQLRSNPPDVKGLDDMLTDIGADSLRVNDVISSVRALFKEITNNRRTTDLADCAQQALDLAQPELLAKQVTVSTGFLDDDAQVFADPVQLQQVILNLIRNSIDAMSSVTPDDRRLRLATQMRGKSTVVFSVQDTGIGIPVANQHRIFDAFFTTKSLGMGLGLAISRTIVESHAGTLHLIGSSREGSTFEIELPIMRKGQ